MNPTPVVPALLSEDEKTLHRMGYKQELSRRMSGFSNFAISFSIICILAGCITSFQVGFCSVGGASIGLGWPLACVFSLVVALTMAQVASAFPTAGGLYHWASILGGRGWGWGTAWFNLLGLVLVIAAVNVGTYQFIITAFSPVFGFDPVKVKESVPLQLLGVSLITFSHALFNHKGIRVTTLLTDFSGYLILVVTLVLTLVLLAFAAHWDFARLITFTNYSGPVGGDTFPRTENMAWLFALGLLLPAYTMTGFDASAHTSEETMDAAVNVPKGIIRSVVISGIFGWVMLCAIVLAAPNLADAAAQGDGSFYWIVNRVLPSWLGLTLLFGIAVSQYLCGLAVVTSASRMVFAFARDGGLPFSKQLRRVSTKSLSPSVAIWTVAVTAILFTVYTPVYATITAACAVFMYISYVLPTAAGLFAHGRTWTRMGPWQLGRWYKPLAVLSIVGCAGLLVVSVAPPFEKNRWVILAAVVLLILFWFTVERRRFPGPPKTSLSQDGAETPSQS